MHGAWLLLAGLLWLPNVSQGADVVAPLAVSARVVPHLRFEAPDATTSIEVSAVDVARGFVDLQRRFAVRSNAPERVMLQIHPRVGLAEAVDISGLGVPLRLDETTVEVMPGLRSRFDLTFRVWLGPTVTPGTYPMPMHVAAVVL